MSHETMPALQRSATIRVPKAQAFVDWLLQHWREEGVHVTQPQPGHLHLALADVGQVELVLASSRQVDCRLQPVSPRMGDVLQLSLAEHLAEFAEEAGWPEAGWSIHWAGASGEAARSAAQLQVMQVVAATALTPRMRRLRLQGPGVVALQGGLHVRLLLPGADAGAGAGRDPVWPVVQTDGRLQWPAGQPRWPRRTYTVRTFDVDHHWIEVDALLHAESAAQGDAPGTRWAQQAVVGSPVGVLSPAGGLLPQAGRCVLVADACALPAAARIVQALPHGAAAQVLLWVADAAERAAWGATGAPAQLTWLEGGLPGASQLEIAQVLQWLQQQFADVHHPARSGTVLWVAGGLPLTQAVRRWVAGQPAMAGVRSLIHTYWR